MPFSPFDPRYRPMPTPHKSADSDMRFQKIDPSTLRNFGTRISDFMTPIKSALNPVFVHPSRQVLHNPTMKPDPKPVLPYDGIVVEWLESRSCLAGKLPLPRRSMIAAGPFKDGNTYLALAGMGFSRFRKGLQIRLLLATR